MKKQALDLDDVFSLRADSSLITPAFEVSPLYHLEPLGIGTGLVEGLASYIVRLARAHCIPPGRLYAQVILRTLTTHGPTTPGLWMNGCRQVIETIVDALQTLTCRSNLRLLTLLDWRRAFSPKKLIRGAQAWCPACLNEWKASGKPMYQPLLWSITAVTVCDLHQMPLRCRCPNCKRAIGPFGFQFEGYCGKCRAWLSDVSDSSVDTTQVSVQEFLNRPGILQLKELLATTAEGSYTGQIGSDVRTLVNHSRWQGCTAFARAAGMMPARLYELFAPKARPELVQLLSICETAEISLKEFLTGHRNASLSAQSDTDRRPYRQFPNPEARQKKTSAALAAALRRYPPISVERVACEIQVSRSYLVRRFPKEVARLQAKMKAYCEERARNTVRILTKALESSNPPSNEILVKQAGVSVACMKRRYPRMCQEIYNKRRSRQLELATKRKQEQLDKIRHACVALHDRGEYPSIGKVASELGWKVSHTVNSLIVSVLREVRAEFRIPIAKF